MFNPGYHVAELVRAGFFGQLKQGLIVSAVIIGILAIGASVLATKVMQWGSR